MPDIVKTQVRIPRNVYKTARDIAKQQGISFNQYVVNSLIDYACKDAASSPDKLKEAAAVIASALEQIRHD